METFHKGHLKSAPWHQLVFAVSENSWHLWISVIADKPSLEGNSLCLFL